MTTLVPTPSIALVNGQPATTSLAIAEHFGKTHDRVLKDIRRIMAETPADFTAVNFAASEYTDSTGRTLPMFTVFFDGFILLVMGYTGKQALQIKLVYIGAFNAMREQLAGKDQPAALESALTPSTPDDRKPLRSIVGAWATASGQPFNVCWSQLKAAFKLNSITELPLEWIDDAIDWVQAKIDAVPKALPAPEPEHTPPLPEIAAFPMYDFDTAMQVTRRICTEITNEGMAFSDRMREAAATITDCFVDKKRRSNVANGVDVLLMAQERSIERLSGAIWSAVHSFYEQGEALYYFARLMKHAEKESEARRRKA